ncbi:MAG: hypothetical protein AABX32_01455 [Nanoarchaeota archaeon]
MAKPTKENHKLFLAGLITSVLISLLANISINAYFRLIEKADRNFYLCLFSISFTLLIGLAFLLYFLYKKL